MERYSLISEKFPREFLLLQGKGCRWRRCRFCDYYGDVGEDSVEVNRAVLERVTGEYGVLDIINSGSAMELDEQTLDPNFWSNQRQSASILKKIKMLLI